MEAENYLSGNILAIQSYDANSSLSCELCNFEHKRGSFPSQSFNVHNCLEPGTFSVDVIANHTDLSTLLRSAPRIS